MGALAVAKAPAGQIVVGVIGAGFRGMQLIHACLDHPSIRIGAVCETYEPRMFGAGAITRARGHKTRYYRLYRDLIADGDITAVIVATPDFSHSMMTLEALKAGKHVYVEQPLCLSWEQGVELLKAERDSNRVVQVGSQRRSSPIYIAAAKGISAGALGHLRMARAYSDSDALRPGVLKRGGVKLTEPLNFFDWQAGLAVKAPFSVDRFLNWRYYSEYGGGAVTSLGCSVLDGIHMLAGANFPLTVKASGVPTTVEGFDTFERAALTVEYPGGQLVTLALDAAAQNRRELTSLDCDAGHADITPDEYTGPPLPRRLVDGEGIATRAHLANFVDAIEGRGSARAPVSAAFGATLVCQMANLSIRAGRTARWNAAEQRVEI